MRAKQLKCEKKTVKWRPYSKATSQEKELAGWIVSDLDSEYFSEGDARGAKFSRQIVSEDNKTVGYLVRMPEKYKDYPLVYLFSFEGEQLAVMMYGQRFADAIFIHPRWFYNGWVVFSMVFELYEAPKELRLITWQIDDGYQEREPESDEEWRCAERPPV